MTNAGKVKMIKVHFEFEKDGVKYTKVLEGDDARQWNDWQIFVCQYADEAGVNPAWHELNWNQTEIKPKGRKKDKKPLEELIEGGTNKE